MTLRKLGSGCLLLMLVLGSLAGFPAKKDLAATAGQPRTILDLPVSDSLNQGLPAGPFDLTPILAEGEPAPGGGGLVVSAIRQVVTNSSGRTAISAEVADPAVGANQRFSLIFLNDQQQTRPIPGLEAAAGNVSLAINERGTVAVFDRTSLTVAHEGGPIYAVHPGDPAPVAGQAGEALTFQQLWAGGDFLNNNDEVGFRAILSDGRRGVFRASRDQTVALAMEGDPVSGRPGEVVDDRALSSAVRLLDDGSIILGSRLESAGILLAHQSQVTAVASAGDRFDSSLVVESLRLLDADETGRILLVVNRHHLFLWEAGRPTRIAGPNDRLPGFPGAPAEFADGFVVPGGSVYFTGVVEPLGGIFLWDRKNVLKVAVDGDRTAAGESFQVSIPPSSFTFHERLFVGFPRPASTSQAVFGSTAGSLVWRPGQLLSFDLEGLALDTETSRLVRLDPLASYSGGGILLRGNVCCYPAVLFRARDAQPRVHHLPYFAAGNAGIQFRSTVEALNLSPFPARVGLEVFDSAGTLLPTSRTLILTRGRNAFSIHQAGLVQGFARLTVENGARVAFSETLTVSGDATPLNDLAIPEQNARHEAEFVFEGMASQLALALTNPGQDEISVEVQLVNSAGSAASRTELRLEAHRQRNGYLSDLLGSTQHRGAGLVRFRSEGAFLVTLLKQSGARLSLVPPLVSRATDAGWGFVNLFPSTVRFGRALSNGQGGMAFTTDRSDHPDLWIRRDGDFVQLLPERVFPPESASTPPYERIEIRELNERGQVLLATTRAESHARELLLWEEGGPRKLLDLGATEPEPPLALNELGLVALGGSNLTLIGDEVEEVAVDHPLLDVSLNRRGDVAFIDAIGVGLYTEGEFVRVAEARRLPGVNSAGLIELFGLAINERRQVFFQAFWSVGVPIQAGAVYYSSDGELKPLLTVGTPLPEHPEWTVTSFGGLELDPDGNPVIPAGVENAQFQSTVALVRLRTEGDLETIFVADPALGLRSLFDVSFGPEGSLVFQAFEEDYSPSAWHWDTRGIRPLLRPGDRVFGQPAEPAAFVGRVTSVRILQTGEILTALELAGGPGAGIFLGAPDFHESVIPLMVDGQFGQVQYRSRLLLANGDASAISARIELFSADGVPIGQPETVDLAPGATRALPLGTGEPLLGWIRIRSSSALRSLLQLSASEATSLRTQVFVEASPLRRQGRIFSFSLAETDQDTAAVFVNPFARTATVELEISDFFGRTQRRQLEIPPFGQATFLHSRDFASVTGTLSGTAVFPVPSAALRISGQILTSLPIQ